MKMFNSGLLTIGALPEVLDGGGVIAYPLKYKALDVETYEVEMSLTKIERSLLGDQIAWIMPMLEVFNQSRLELVKNNWKLKKVLLAVNYLEEGKTSSIIDIAHPGHSMVSREAFGYPLLKGCLKFIPLNEEERFLCDIHGIIYV